MTPSLDGYFPFISRILSVLQSGDVDQFPKRKKINNIIQESGMGRDIVLSTLSLLAILGFVEIGDDEDVIVSSKYPNIAISAIRERLDLSVPLSYNLRETEKKRYFRDFTKSLELVRNESHGGDIPIHNREMVNIIIKGRQIRNWIYQDVFLHVYHSDWNEYHLVGLGRRGESTIDELAQKTMKNRLNLEPIDYEFDLEIKPPPIEYKAISKSQGALTFYTIYTRVIKKLHLDLNEYLERLIHEKEGFTTKTFRWFSLKEINQRNIADMSIMESTPRVLKNLDISRIPITVGKAKRNEDEPLFDIKIRSSLPNRIDLAKAVIHLLAIIVILGITNIGRIINLPLYWLDNLNNIASIIGLFISVFVVVRGLREST